MEKSELKDLKYKLIRFQLYLDIHMFRFSMSYEDTGIMELKKQIENILKLIEREI